jgi:hypothetical protein
MAHDAEKGSSCTIGETHNLYVEELKLEAAGYRDIRSYFVKLTGSVGETPPPASPFD